jgi:cysteinyl-tRNA synthetase
MNITDVDDRIIKDLMAKGVTLEELTAPHIERFVADLDKLHIGPPDKLARATEHIPEMATIIKRLVDSGHAYAVDDGSIFFRISTWPSYGVLAKLDPEQAQSTERVAADDYGKDDVRDFAVWKGTKPGELVEYRGRNGAPWLAHRVLGDEHEISRRVLRHSHRWCRSDLPAP